MRSLKREGIHQQQTQQLQQRQIQQRCRKTTTSSEGIIVHLRGYLGGERACPLWFNICERYYENGEELTVLASLRLPFHIAQRPQLPFLTAEMVGVYHVVFTEAPILLTDCQFT